MLRRKGGDPLEGEGFTGSTNRVPDGENAGIEDTEDVAGVSLLHDFAFLGHHLLGLGQADFFAPLDMENLLPLFELAGTDAHESHPVPVGFVHIRLDLEYEGGKIRAEGIDFPG